MEPLKLAILSRGPRLYSTRRLREAAEKRGHKVKVLDTMKFALYIEAGRPDLTYGGKALSSYDAIIPRIGTSVTFFGSSVVRQFEQMGTYCLNTADAILASRDKLASMQELSSHNIGIAETAFVRNPNDVLKAIQAMGGAPVVIKLLQGTQGIGVILAETNKVAEAIIETLSAVKQNVLVQKFVSESKGRDIRAFVVGDRVVAAMRRTAAGQEFRSNVHRGGNTQSVTLDPEYERTAVKAAQILNLSVAGVDMLEGKDGPVIMEVNSSPGLEGIEGATGVDIAGEIVKFMEEQIRFGNFDIRERLSLTKGYAVTEFAVEPNSEIAGKTIIESGLRERDVVVMRLVRGQDHIANPKGTRVIEAGDHLLCYGLRAALQGFLPAFAKAKRRKKKSTLTKKATKSADLSS
ncbi:30S ribosomal protein S6--L-glutamate ligase [Pelagicoccus sp. SDUM812002]|uniref:30S ribosomal protein S6--L-glutamate ligase n=1 Tax=Pelagicoccus sp. SDUM812002 TaxID=3041266 RepID=UPI00280D21E9|nr:30S ribosomal protein S6--L-glutamate ligase [Pelagicoccus sp. SDUM812002]MDQ8184377.1 30S ribosomal protein S6--L-glutamate ligase [Pelagicoccus sp. SDUM812002]